MSDNELEVMSLTAPIRARIRDMRKHVLYDDETTYGDILAMLEEVKGEIDKYISDVKRLEKFIEKHNTDTKTALEDAINETIDSASL